MIKKTGTVLVAVLVIAGVIALFSGVVERLWPAPQSSPSSQQFVEPDKPVNNFPFTTLGTLKNQKQRLEIIKATASVVDKEYIEKIASSQAAFDKLIGSIDNPGLLGAGALALLTMYATALYKNNTMYSETEYQAKKV